MSNKNERIASLIDPYRGRGLEANYLAYFACFNRQQFYEAHEVLEQIWLPVRNQPDGLFYKGLIQLAGAFVHLQKARLQPAASLFGLAKENLGKYQPAHKRLDVSGLVQTIEIWLGLLKGSRGENPFFHKSAPEIWPKLEENEPLRVK